MLGQCGFGSLDAVPSDRPDDLQPVGVANDQHEAVFFGCFAFSFRLGDGKSAGEILEPFPLDIDPMNSLSRTCLLGAWPSLRRMMMNRLAVGFRRSVDLVAVVSGMQLRLPRSGFRCATAAQHVAAAE